MNTHTLLATIGLAALLATTAASAQDYSRHCWWEQGVYACIGTIETDRFITTTLCSGGEYQPCKTWTVPQKTLF